MATHDGSFQVNPISPDDLRHYLLYWDRIDVPCNSAVSYRCSDKDQEVLECEGILTRTAVDVSEFGLPVSEPLVVSAMAQANSYETNNRKSDESWVICQPSTLLQLPSQKKTSIVEIELRQSLPVPASDIEIDDILSFKEERRDQLMEFRLAMDTLYLDVVNSADTERSLEVACQTIEGKLTAINTLMVEQKWRRFIPDLKVQLDLPDLVAKVAAGAAIGYNHAMPLLGAGFGLTLSALSVKIELSPKPNSLPADLQPYAYLHHAKHELQ